MRLWGRFWGGLGSVFCTFWGSFCRNLRCGFRSNFRCVFRCSLGCIFCFIFCCGLIYFFCSILCCIFRYIFCFIFHSIFSNVLNIFHRLFFDLLRLNNFLFHTLFRSRFPFSRSLTTYTLHSSIIRQVLWTLAFARTSIISIIRRTIACRLFYTLPIFPIKNIPFRAVNICMNNNLSLLTYPFVLIVIIVIWA